MQMDEPSVRPRRIVEALCAASVLCILSVALVDHTQPSVRSYSAAVHPLEHVALRSRLSRPPADR